MSTGKKGHINNSLSPRAAHSTPSNTGADFETFEPNRASTWIRPVSVASDIFRALFALATYLANDELAQSYASYRYDATKAEQPGRYSPVEDDNHFCSKSFASSSAQITTIHVG